jgi:ankyrin repeat protein
MPVKSTRTVFSRRAWLRQVIAVTGGAHLAAHDAWAGSYDDFFSALRGNQAEVIKVLLARGFDPNTLDADGTHGLLVAMKAQAHAAALVLASHPKVKPDPKTPQDETPLMLASLRGEMGLVNALLARDADINRPGWTPLHYAATGGKTEVMGLLLERHAYIDTESPNGTTPLMMAAQYGTPRAVKHLLEAGADPTLKNSLGLTALDFAQRGNRSESAELISAFIRGRRPQGDW